MHVTEQFERVFVIKVNISIDPTLVDKWFLLQLITFIFMSSYSTKSFTKF